VASNCETCGESFTPQHPNRPGRFCSLACYHAAGRPPRKAKVKHRMRAAGGHPIAPPSGVVAVARLVLYDKIGPGAHPCHWCERTVRWVAGGPGAPGALLVDHLDHDATNDTPENLVPSCIGCNGHRRRKGDSPRLAADELTMIWSGTRVRAVARHCNFCGQRFLTIPAEVRSGKGRYCSRSCARRGPSTSAP
jgi:hypothetical protein